MSTKGAKVPTRISGSRRLSLRRDNGGAVIACARRRPDDCAPHVMTKTIQRNLIWLTASQIATWTGSLVLVVVVPRHLTAAEFGSIQFALAFVGYFMLVAGLGTSTFLVKEIARDESTVGPFIVNALAMKVLLTIVLSAMAILLAHVLGYSGQTIVLIEIACV